MWDVIQKMLKGTISVPVANGDEPDMRLGRGTLSFGDNHEQPTSNKSSSNEATFEVVSTRIAIDQNDKKHVAYTVLIHPANGTGIPAESPPKAAVLERRYTDFLNLHSAIKLISDSLPPFPRKCLLGNFSASLIAGRSEAFERLLNEIAASPVLRTSEALAAFLCTPGQKTDPVLLENEFRALDAVRGIQDRRHPLVMYALLRLVVCLDSVGQGGMAEQFAEEALRRLEVASDADVLRFYVPLLQLSARLRVDRGADIEYISTRLAELRCQGIETARGPSLEQMLANK